LLAAFFAPFAPFDAAFGGIFDDKQDTQQYAQISG